MFRRDYQSRIVVLFTFLAALLVAPAIALSAVPVRAQDASPAALSCAPSPLAKAADAAAATPATTAAAPSGDLVKVKLGYVPALIFAPVFVAKEKGYYIEQGLDVSLEAFTGGPNPVVLTATGELDFSIAGMGPAFWNAVAQGLPIKVVAPGHAEGSPVATPLMISQAACESGAIASVADLQGKKVSVNGPGATEYWLSQALATAGLTLNDIDLQTLPFPDAVAALASNAIDAAMIGEPLATSAEQQGLAVRLATDFPVQGIQPTVLFANADFLSAHPDAATGLVTAYLKASRDLTSNFSDPANLAIIEQYMGVPAELIATAVKPVYPVDGAFDLAGMATLQSFFRERGQLEYDADLDPATIVDTRFVDAALAALGPYQGT